MTREQQRIAIAEACGWKTGYRDPEAWHPLPDYLNDLNAMHEAEKAMNNNDWWKFVEHLTNICGGGTALGISATASQRAEAFLRTIGKWEEAK
jgi:hypothetical protein